MRKGDGRNHDNKKEGPQTIRKKEMRIIFIPFGSLAMECNGDVLEMANFVMDCVDEQVGDSRLSTNTIHYKKPLFGDGHSGNNALDRAVRAVDQVH
ncbi:hypothetical protein [Burkholderia sp. L27(2015)]|uniref:hypothetical protein n=1 Tax=Burkholderia sp. L27(2015) TaxID=1641858 RepID=UPI00131C9D14|nr:hypothetical protein [Burkholderia sp. L27(2015)]